MSRRLAALALVVAAAILSPGAASAAGDSGPLAMEPGMREELSRGPSAVTMAFPAPVVAETARIYVLDPDGKNVTSSPPTVDSINVSVLLDSGLKSGTYSVYYRANDSNDQVIGGAYQFAIGKGSWSKLDSPDQWVGRDDQPKIFAGNNPNQPSDGKEPKAEATGKAGIEIVTEDGTILRPSATEPQPKTAEDSSSGTSSLPWIIGGAAILAVAAVAGLIVAKRRKPDPAYAGKRVRDADDPDLD